MATTTVTAKYNGIGFGSLLLLLFIGLKLGGVIDWSWWWVLSPLWIGFGLGVVCFLIGVLIYIATECKKS